MTSKHVTFSEIKGIIKLSTFQYQRHIRYDWQLSGINKLAFMYMCIKVH